MIKKYTVYDYVPCDEYDCRYNDNSVSNHFKYIVETDIDYLYIIDKKVDFIKNMIEMIQKHKKIIYICCYILNFTPDTIDLCRSESIDMLRFRSKELMDRFQIQCVEEGIKIRPSCELIKVITFGTYDLYHYGHSRLLDRCSLFTDDITVGVSSNEMNVSKGKITVDDYDIRYQNVSTVKHVKKVFCEESLELKNQYIKEQNCNLLIMGDDWIDRFNWVDCPDIYLPRTPGISSTMIKKLNGLL